MPSWGAFMASRTGKYDYRNGLKITRRDFLNGVLIGAGSSLLPPSAALSAQATLSTGLNETWYGFGGIGDYALSHGNSPEVVARAHEIADGYYNTVSADVIDTDELFDVVIVGGGMAGLGAAFEFSKIAAPNQRCLLLENHPVFGGESKRNEFKVNGHHLIAPQGANGFSVPVASDDGHTQDDAYYYQELNIPREFEYQSWDKRRKPLRFCSDNYGFMYWLEQTASIGYFSSGTDREGGLDFVTDAWESELRGTAYSNMERQELLAWRKDAQKPYEGQDFERWLDTMSYKDYVEKVMGLGPHVTAYADPILASAVGLGCDVVSAFAAAAIRLPGVRNFRPPIVPGYEKSRHSFPGGNDGFARHLVKRIIPKAISGTHSFDDILNGRINFGALDATDQAIRMRLGSTVVAVEHGSEPESSDFVYVTYVKGNKRYRLKARGVVMASGAWVNRAVIRNLPGDYRKALSTFQHAPFLVANVALTNWRFLYDRGITACRYDGPFGDGCNIRHPMIVGDYRPPLDPDKPIVLTFYVSFIFPGLPVREQVIKGRTELLTSSYAQYEERIVSQMKMLFGESFVPDRDLAGIILNRWGHAYVVPTPGFYFGRDGEPAPRDIIRRGFGRIAVGHSELRGNQHWGPAAEEGKRAMQQVLSIV
jgi:spermidine dehydrogenase